VATLIGIGGMAGAVGGMIFQVTAGMLLDKLGAAGYATLFGICASAYLIAFAISHLLAPRFEPLAMRD